VQRLFSTFLIFACLFATGHPTRALEPPNLEQVELEVALAPPHNEPVVGDKVARYRAELKGDVCWGRLQWEPKITAWGVNTWRSTDRIGHGWNAWQNSDYSIEKVRVSHTQNLSFWLNDNIALTTEYYMPLNRKSWGGHGLERHYYWLVGFRWQLF
jgi:hypothetical protein